MPIDRSRHKSYLQNILIDISAAKELLNTLAFKGGTCLMFFYDLDRFSTDLDFSCLVEDFKPEFISRLLSENYPELKFEYTDKYHTYFWLINTGKKEVNIKIEIRKQDFISALDTYEIKDMNGISIKTMSPECMLAHKLCAALDRRQNRDLYDIWFMLSKGFEIKSEIVEKENLKFKNINLKDYLIELKKHIQENINQGNVLDDIGNLLYTDAQKNRVRATLIPKLLGEIDLRIGAI